MLKEVKGCISMKKTQWKLDLVKILVVVSVINVIAQYLLTETVYVASTTVAGLEGNNVQTYIIMMIFLGGVAVAASNLLATLLFGDILDPRSSWSYLLSGITVVATAHLHGLMTIASLVLGTFFIVAGICILCSSGFGGTANVATEQVGDSEGRN